MGNDTDGRAVPDSGSGLGGLLRHVLLAVSVVGFALTVSRLARDDESIQSPRSEPGSPDRD